MDSSSSRVFAVNSILLNTKTRWNKKIKCPKSWWKVYENINICLNQFSRKLFDELKQEFCCSSELDEVTSGLSKLDLDVISNEAIASLNQEMENDVQWMIISDEKASCIVEVIVSDLNNVLRRYGFIENKWSTFGSYKTGLGCIDSDVDLYFENLERINKTVDIPSSIVSCLKKSPSLFSSIKYIKSAQIPIIKFTHISTGKECDISFSDIGVKSSALSKFYVQLTPSVKVLTLYLKLLLKKYLLYGTNRMTTHVIFWLVVFFLQQKKLLPPVKDVRKKYVDCNGADLFNNWNFSVNDDFSFPSSTRSDYSSLFLEFAKFYRDFDFSRNVISPYLGYVIPVEKLAEWKIPEEILPRDSQRFNSDGKNTFRRHVINMQEPSILSLNLSKSVVFKVVNFFKIMCNELVSSVEKYSSSNNFMELLPSELPRKNVLPRDLMQCTSIKVHFKALSEFDSGEMKEYLCRAIHRIMGATLQFELRSKAVEDVFQVEFADGSKVREEITMPVIYMSYSSTPNTWKNDNVSKLLLFPNRPRNLNEGHGRLVKVYFVCVIDPREGNVVRIMIETDMYLLRFLHKYGPRMLQQTIFA